MGLLESVKPFWPLLFTLVLPWALRNFRALRVAWRTRPAPRPLPKKTSRGLNTLFTSICVFLYASLPSFSNLDGHNVFVITRTRLANSSDLIFTRLAALREGGVLTSFDEALRDKFTSQGLRLLYLRYGPYTLTGCTFCTPDNEYSYLLYYLPTAVLFPHLLHVLALGVATSETIAGYEASRFRKRAFLGATAVFLIDLLFVSTYTPRIPQVTLAPAGVYWPSATVRYVVLMVFDATVAFLIYASATGRFFLFSAPPTDPEVLRRRTDELLVKSNLALQVAATSLRAATIVRNSVVRDEKLKAVDDEYWKRVVVMEGQDGHDVFEDEEVQEAVSRAYGSGGVDVRSMRKEAESFVKAVTKPLDTANGTANGTAA